MSSKKKSSGSHGRDDHHDRDHHGHHSHHGHHGGSDKGVTLKGTKADNVLTGTDRNDKLFGLDGNDKLFGLAGDDKLDGGKGNDALDGGAGRDTLIGGKGNDSLQGGSGNDILYGDQAGKGWAWGSCLWWKPQSGDDDFLDGGAGNDKVYGGRGNDLLLYSMAGNLGEGFADIGTHDVYDGGSGFDTLKLALTHGEFLLASVQRDIAAFQAFLECSANPRSDHGKTFHFQSFDLDARNFEALAEIQFVNTAPTANGDTAATDEDTALLIAAPGLLANDTDLDHLDALKVIGADALSARGAVVHVGANGSVSYDPTAALALQQLAEGVTTTDSFSYTIADLGGLTATATVQVTVTGVNDTPVAVADAKSTDEDHAVNGNALANDTDVDIGDTFHVSAVNGSSVNVGSTIELASGALLTVDADGSYSYDPNDQFEYLAVGESTTDGFTYIVADNHGAASNTAATEILIEGVNDLPVANDDSNRIVVTHGFEGATNPGNVDGSTLTGFDTFPSLGVGGSWMAYAYTDNDFVEDGADGALQRGGQDFALLSLDVAAYFVEHPVTIAAYDDGVRVASLVVDLDVAGPSNGSTGYTTLSFGAAWDSIDQVRFYADDVADLTFIDNVRLAIGTIGDEDTPIDFDVLANDTDVDASDVLTIDTFSPQSAMGAAVSLNADGTLRYDATSVPAVQALAVGETATDTFTYSVSDGHGGADGATVTVRLVGVNDVPVAADDLVAAPTGGGTQTESVLAFDGAISLDDMDGYSVQGFFQFAGAGVGGSDVAAVATGFDGASADGADGALQRVDGQNFALLSLRLSANVAAHPVIIKGYDNDHDVPVVTLSADAGLLAAGYGTVTFDSSWGSIDLVRFYADTGDYTLMDDVHVATGSGGEASNEDATTDIDVLANDDDVDASDVLQVSALDFTSAKGAAISLNANGTLRYDPTAAAAIQALAAGELTTDTFEYTVSDGHGGTDVATVTVELRGANDAPVVADDAYAVDPGTTLTVDGPGVLDNDTDIEGDALTAALVGSGPAHGDLTFNADGSFSYQPDAGYSGEDSFTYLANDGALNSVPATVHITVSDVNAAPNAVNDAASTNEDTVVSGNVLSGVNGGKDTDADGDALFVTTTGTFATALGASVTLGTNGAFTYDPRGSDTLQALNAGQSKVDSFVYEIGDGNGGTDPATVSITVAGRAESSGASGSGKIMQQVGPEANVKYYVSFENLGGEWLELESFSLGFDQSVALGKAGSGASAGKATAQDVQLVLGSSASVVKLTDALASGQHLKGASIEAWQGGEKPLLLDRFDFDDVIITSRQASGGDSGAQESLSFAYSKFDHAYKEQKADGSAGPETQTGWDFKGSKEASAQGVPSGGGSKAKLDDQQSDLDYYVRFEGMGGNQWLQLDDFSMGLNATASSGAGGSKAVGKLSADEVSLLLGASKVIVELNEALLKGTHLKNFEVEAYSAGGEGKAQLVDEFWFEDVLVTQLEHTQSTSNQVELAFGKFSHGHIELKADGTAGPHTEAGWDFVKNVEFSKSPSPGADLDKLVSQVGPEANVKYYVSFENLGGEWLELESFSLGFDQSVALGKAGSGASAGKATAQDVQLVLGSSASVVKLTDALASGQHLKGASIEAWQGGEKPLLLDRFDFDDVIITSRQASGGDSGAQESLSFAYSKFDHAYKEQKADGSAGPETQTGWDFKGSKEASAQGVPSGGGSKAKLDDQQSDLDYYVRFEGMGGNQWLQLDDFSMGLNATASSGAGGSKAVGKLSADEVSLLLGASKVIVELNEALLKGTHLKNFEVEAYSAGGEGKAQLVDEFWFEDVLVTQLEHTQSTSNQVELAFGKFSHGHIELKADGTAGPHTEAGWDFVKNVEFSKSPSPGADLDKLVSQVGPEANVKYYVSFENLGGEWLELESFSLGFDQSVALGKAGSGASAGKATAQDVQLVLGSSASVVKLTDALASGQHLKGASIEAWQGGEKPLLLDRFDFDDVIITSRQASGGDSGAQESLSFAYSKFDHAYKEQKADGSAGPETQTGWDFKGSKEASAQGVPSGGGSKAKLDDQQSDLDYYVRFEGMGGNQWLQLDDFSMGLNATASSGAGGSKAVGKLSADEVSLLLGASKVIVELNEALLKGTHLKNFEVEAYSAGGEGKAQLVDEFWFEDVLVTQLEHTQSTSNQVELAFGKFSHGHIELKADGSAGPHTEAGWDFVKNVEWTHGAPHGDIDFLL